MPSISFYFQPFPSRVYLDFARGALWFCCIRICCPSSVFDRVAQVCKTCAIFGYCVVSSCLYLRVCERMIDGTVKSEDFTRIGFLNGISVFERSICSCWCVPSHVLHLLSFFSWNSKWLDQPAGPQSYLLVYISRWWFPTLRSVKWNANIIHPSSYRLVNPKSIKMEVTLLKHLLGHRYWRRMETELTKETEACRLVKSPMILLTTRM